MIRATCFNCKQKFTLDEKFVAVELAKLGNPHPRFFTAHCPRCRRAIKVSLRGVRLPEASPSAAGELARGKAEVEEPGEQ